MSDEVVPFVTVLTEAGLRVVEGHGWESRGTPLIEADRIVVDAIETEGTVADIERFKAGAAPTAYVARNGKVWLLGQAVEGHVVIVVAGEPTVAQLDAAAALTAVMEAVAFDAEVRFNLSPPKPAEPEAKPEPAKKAPRRRATAKPR